MLRRQQNSFRFSSAPDPRYCAKAFCRAKRLKAPTHQVTVGKQVYRVCATCARPFESVRGAKVERIAPEVSRG